MLTPFKKHSMSEEIFNQLKDNIENASFQKGDKLPTEKELCETFAVSRQPVREALKSLQMLGYIESKQGEGSFVIYDQHVLKFQPINFSILSDQDYFDLLEMRHIIEVQAAGLCAERHDAKDIEQIERFLMDIETQMSDDLSIGFEADYAFHAAIIKGSKNKYIEETFNNISDKYLDGLKQSLSMNIGNDQKRKDVIAEHRDVFLAIKKRDAKSARKAMNEHITNLRKKIGDKRME